MKLQHGIRREKKTLKVEQSNKKASKGEQKVPHFLEKLCTKLLCITAAHWLLAPVSVLSRKWLSLPSSIGFVNP